MASPQAVSCPHALPQMHMGSLFTDGTHGILGHHTHTHTQVCMSLTPSLHTHLYVPDIHAQSLCVISAGSDSRCTHTDYGQTPLCQVHLHEPLCVLCVEALPTPLSLHLHSPATSLSCMFPPPSLALDFLPRPLSVKPLSAQAVPIPFDHSQLCWMPVEALVSNRHFWQGVWDKGMGPPLSLCLETPAHRSVFSIKAWLGFYIRAWLGFKKKINSQWILFF